jgi:hypothetical protein
VVGPFLVTFSLFWAPKTHFRIGKIEGSSRHGASTRRILKIF